MPRLPRLREVREKKFMSQQELADAAGVGRITVLRLEGSEREANWKTARKLAKALGVKPQELTAEE